MAGRAHLQLIHKSEQAAFGRAVMARAKSQAGLDLYGDVAGAALVTIMRAMDEYAARTDRLEPLQRSLHPILLFKRKENALVRLYPDEGAQQVTDCGLVGRMREIGLQHPR